MKLDILDFYLQLKYIQIFKNKTNKQLIPKIYTNIKKTKQTNKIMLKTNIIKKIKKYISK